MRPQSRERGEKIRSCVPFGSRAGRLPPGSGHHFGRRASMNVRTLSLLLVGVGLFLMGSPTRASVLEHEPIHKAIKELKEAKKFLDVEKRHEKVESAHKALKEAIKYVAETKGLGGEHRERLIKRLEKLDKELLENWKKAGPILDEAIEDLEFAAK